MKITKLTCIAIVSAFATILYADEAEQTIELDDLIVVGKYLQSDEITALKTPTPIKDVPQSVSILTSDLISIKNLDSLGEISDYVPGITAGQGEGHRDDIIFRGISKSTADFFVDGVRDDVQYYRPLYNVEQVEILKGPNALFFGRGGTGGIINRVSKSAQIGDEFTEYSFSMDQEGEESYQIDTNLDLGNNAALRFNYYSEELDNHRNFYYGDNSGFNPTLNLKLNDKTSANFSYELLDQERFIDRGIPSLANGTPAESLSGITFGSETENYSTLDAHIMKMSIDHRINDNAKLRLNFISNDFDKVYQNLYASSYTIDPLDPNADSVELDGYRDTTQRESTIFSADLITEKEIAGLPHNIVIGFEKIDTENNNDRFYMDTDNLDDETKGEKITVTAANSYAITDSFNFTTEEYDGTEAQLEVHSLYFSDEIAVNEKLDVIVGGRLDNYDLSVTDVFGNSGGDADKTDDVFSPRLGFVYKPTSNASYYLSFSESFIPKSGEQYADLKGDKRREDPDTYENKEVGAKFDLSNGISLTASYFDLTAVKPTGTVEDGDYAVTENNVKGFELQSIGNITDRWFISAGACIITEGDDSEPSIYERPKKTYSIWNLFDMSDKLTLGLGLVHKDQSNGKGNTTLPSYDRVDAVAYYSISDNLRLQINAENITDETYYPYSYGSHQISVGAPTNYTFKVVGKF